MLIDHQAIRALAAEFAPETIALRRDLHQHPELGHHETRTTERIIETLESHGVATRRA